MNGLSSPKATWEGEEAQREVETRALLSGPFLPTTRHKAEKEKERAVDRSAGETRGHHKCSEAGDKTGEPLESDVKEPKTNRTTLTVLRGLDDHTHSICTHLLVTHVQNTGTRTLT